MGKAIDRINREIHLMPIVAKGYSRKAASNWYELVKKDQKRYAKKYTKQKIKAIHKAGYLCSTLEKYGVDFDDLNSATLVSDFDYCYLRPYNSSFSKWIDDILTTNRILLDHQNVCRDVYYSIVRRNSENLILKNGGSESPSTIHDVVQLLEEKQHLEFRPTHWKSTHKRYQLSMTNDVISMNGQEITEKELEQVIASQSSNYIIADPVDLTYPGNGDYDHTLKLWLANDSNYDSPILEATLNIYYTQKMFVNGEFTNKRKQSTFIVNIDDGSFEWDGKHISLPNWKNVVDKIEKICDSLKPLTYFTMSVALQESAVFKIVHFDAYPILPGIAFGNKLNEYLKNKAEAKRASYKLTFKDRIKEIKGILWDKYVAHFCRKGVRPYMQKVWENAVKDDLLHTKGATLSKKIWCWKHGFYSYRLWQYGVNESNYRKFLTDYDYIWLNRINNDYQKWVNDKTTYRYIMEPCKKYAPKYYFSVFKRNNQAEICRMPDCPVGVTADFESVLSLLKSEGKLAFKPSAGTHGDGFYCLAYEDDTFFVNGTEKSPDEVLEVLKGQKSFYIVTEYLVMHEMLRNIYSNSVNTIRVMVVNKHGYDPKIFQTYMRIGSSKTGFTDNVGYGGICAKIDKDTGEIYKPQTISKHVFYDCPVHPDSNTDISGYLPNWNMLREAILSIARYLGELEYLGFDVVLTETGICVLEINIHQDLHQVADFTEEMNTFFKEKIANKNRIYGL